MDTSLPLLLMVIIGFKFSPSVAQQTGICDPVTNNCNNGVCQLQTNNQYGCVCFANHIRNPDNPLVCNLIQPCDPANTQHCVNGICQLQASGVYGCTCNPGFQVSGRNTYTCEDINECTLPLTGCAANSCTDMVGDYMCTACVPGWFLDQFGKCQATNQVVPGQTGGFPTGVNGGMFPGFPGMFPTNFAGSNPWMWAMMMDEFFKK